jgi:hypothetical protein
LSAVGSGGAILTSPDGIAWTKRSSGTAQRLNSVTLTGSQLVAVGRNSTILASSDGINWASQTSGTDPWLICPFAKGTDTLSSQSLFLSSVVWAGNRLVAVGGDRETGTVWLTSYDGVSAMSPRRFPGDGFSLRAAGEALLISLPEASRGRIYSACIRDLAGVQIGAAKTFASVEGYFLTWGLPSGR